MVKKVPQVDQPPGLDIPGPCSDLDDSASLSHDQIVTLLTSQ